MENYMGNRTFAYFLALSLFGEKGRHISTVLLSILIVFLLSSVLFISSSLHSVIENALSEEPDLVVQRVEAGRLVNLPLKWEEEILSIRGVSKVTPRIWGRYFTGVKGKSFLVIAVDFLDENSHKTLEKLIGETELETFLDGRHMIVGYAVMEWMKSHFYKEYYNFIGRDGEIKKMKISKVLPKEDNALFADTIIMGIESAREIFGISEDEATDLILDIPNDAERDFIADKISSLHYDIRTISKKESRAAYDRMFNFKGGFFLSLFCVVLLAFVLILYQRYSQVYSREKRQIGIFRALGWSMGDVLKLKFLETLGVVTGSYIIGVSIAYIYVYILGAPLLKNIFMGNGNLDMELILPPVLDFSALSSIFLLYALPFIAAVLIPVWRISVSDPKEAML